MLKPKVIPNMLLFQWRYLTAKCYVTLEFPAWAPGSPGPWCSFNCPCITARWWRPSKPCHRPFFTLALQHVRHARKEEEYVFRAHTVIFFPGLLCPPGQNHGKKMQISLLFFYSLRRGWPSNMEAVTRTFLLRIKQPWQGPLLNYFRPPNVGNALPFPPGKYSTEGRWIHGVRSEKGSCSL